VVWRRGWGSATVEADGKTTWSRSHERKEFHSLFGESAIDADEDEALQLSLSRQHAVELVGMVRGEIAASKWMSWRNRGVPKSLAIRVGVNGAVPSAAN
jgi:hypothetical protein